jgi:LysM repeat protein
MVWQTDAEDEAYEEAPYSTLSGEKAGGIMSRREFPFILLGIGLLLLLLVFFIFSSGSSRSARDRLSEIPERLDQMEGRLAELEGLQQRLDRLEAQVMNLGKAFAEEKKQTKPDTRLIDELRSQNSSIKQMEERLNLLEERLNRVNTEVRKAKKAPAAPAERPQAAGVHVVEKGDTLYSIARTNQVDLQRFLKLNGLKEDSVIYPGQRLKIPEK